MINKHVRPYQIERVNNMSKGIKVFLGFVLVLTLIVMLNSCGGKKSEPSTPAPAPPAEQKEPAKESTKPPALPSAEKTPAQPAEPKGGTAPAVATGGKPKIVCDEPEFDFGERRNDEKVEHEFIVKNAGDGLLLIDKVKTTCGCTVAQPEKKDLQPGESTKIKATLTLANRQGPQTKQITVESNDPETPVLTLTIKGVATDPILIEPRTINLGTDIMEDTVGEQIVEVKSNLPDLTFNITKVDLTNLPEFKADLETVEEGKYYKIKLNQVKKIEPGTYTKRFTIETDAVLPGKDKNDPSLMALRKRDVSVYGRFIGAINISPEVISIRANNEDPNAKTQQYLRIKEGKEKGLKILEVIPPIPEIGVDVTERAPGDYLILVKDIPMNNSVKDKELVVKTSSPTKPEIKIPFRVLDIPNIPTRLRNVMGGEKTSGAQGPKVPPQLPNIKPLPNDQLPKPPTPPERTPQQVPAQPPEQK